MIKVTYYIGMNDKNTLKHFMAFLQLVKNYVDFYIMNLQWLKIF